MHYYPDWVLLLTGRAWGGHLTFFKNFNPCFITLHRTQKPIGESPRFVSLNIPFLVKGTKKVSFISFIQWLLQMSVIHWSIVLAKIDLVSLYFHLLWYHSILRDSTDQKHAKTGGTSVHRLVLIGLHDFLIFSNRTAHAWSVEAGNICSVSVFFVRVGSQISPRRAKKDSNIPSPGRTRSVKCPTPGPTKTIKSPPHALLPPLPPTGFTLISALANSFGVSIPNHFLWRRKSTITTSFTDKSPAGDQLWNSGRQYWIFSCIGDQEGTISDPNFDHLDEISVICGSQVDIGKVMWSKGSWEMCWLHPSIATSCKLTVFLHL